MGNKVFDQYSFLHFCVGGVLFYWNISFIQAIIIHTIFEYFENLFTSKIDVEIITKCEHVAESISTVAGFYDFTVNDKKIKARFTFVFLKNKERWEILSHHSSLLPE